MFTGTFFSIEILYLAFDFNNKATDQQLKFSSMIC